MPSASNSLSPERLEELRKAALAIHDPRKWYTAEELRERRAIPEEDGKLLSACDPQTILDMVSELTELRDYAKAATKAITELTAGGSEYFGKRIGDIYTADLPFCVERIRERQDRLRELAVQSAVAAKSLSTNQPTGAE